MAPPRPPMAGPPGAPPMPPPAPAMGPPPPPPPMGPAGLGPASPLAGLFSDLSPHMGPGWQQIDLAVRAVRTALRSVDFQKIPAVVAVLQDTLNTMTELLSHYTSGTSGATASSVPREPSDAGAPPSSDADAMPAMGGGDMTREGDNE